MGYNIYEFTKFSKQKTSAGTTLRPQINAKISDMKNGHFSNEKTVSNGTNVLKSAGVQQQTIAKKPTVRELRVTQDVRIFFFESKNANDVDTLSLVCMGHMQGNDVSLNP